MNIKITKEQHNKLSKYNYKQYLFGSQLHGITTVDSDFDYVRVISDDFYKEFKTKAIYLPNIHSLQFDDKDNNTQYVWMTETQFYRGLFSGDGNMICDIVLLSGEFENPMKLCRTYKIIKAFLGVAKRDLKLHRNDRKKNFHAYRSIMMAKKLLDNEIPTVENIKEWKNEHLLPTPEYLTLVEKTLRTRLNEMLDNKEIDLYPYFKEENELVQILVNTNNIKEFKYD